MGDLEQPALLDDPVQLVAVGADGDLLAEVDDLLAHRLLGEVGHLAVLHLGAVEVGHERLEQDAGARLADALECLEGKDRKKGW